MIQSLGFFPNKKFETLRKKWANGSSKPWVQSRTASIHNPLPEGPDMPSLMKMLVPVLLLAALLAPVALADEGHKHETKAPESYSAAVGQIQHSMDSIKELVKNGKLKAVHEDAGVIMAACKVLPQLALKEGSGVPKDAVKEINLTSKDLAKAADAAHDAADKGDAEGTKKAYASMLPLYETLKKHATAKAEHAH